MVFILDEFCNFDVDDMVNQGTRKTSWSKSRFKIMYVKFSTLAQLILSTKVSKSNDFAYLSILKLAYAMRK